MSSPNSFKPYISQKEMWELQEFLLEAFNEGKVKEGRTLYPFSSLFRVLDKLTDSIYKRGEYTQKEAYIRAMKEVYYRKTDATLDDPYAGLTGRERELKMLDDQFFSGEED